MRRHYRRFARRAATACYGLVAVGMGVLLSFAGLQKLGVALAETVALAGLAAAAVGLVSALPISAWLAWAQRRREPNFAVGQEISLQGHIQGIVSSDTKVLVCTGAASFEVDGLGLDEVRRLKQKHASETHHFESGAPPRARLWWMVLVGTGLVASSVLAVIGVTIDHLMPLAVYTSVFVASTTALLSASARDLRIGIDGVRMGSEFVSYGSLQQLAVDKGRLILVRRDGRRIAGSLQVEPEIGVALDALVQQRIDAKTSDGEAYEVQNEESFEVWLKRVRGRFDATSFREAPASVDSAKELLRDAKVPFRVRVGVAVALSPIDAAYVGEALDGLVHPEGAALKEALSMPSEAQATRLRELVAVP